MQLMTKAIVQRFCRVGRQDHADAEVVVKFFTPWSNWTWYATAATLIMADGRAVEAEQASVEERRAWQDLEFFGFVQGLEAEYGYFRLSELQSIRGPRGLTVERDLYFDGVRLRDLVGSMNTSEGNGRETE